MYLICYDRTGVRGDARYFLTKWRFRNRNGKEHRTGQEPPGGADPRCPGAGGGSAEAVFGGAGQGVLGAGRCWGLTGPRSPPFRRSRGRVPGPVGSWRAEAAIFPLYHARAASRQLQVGGGPGCASATRPRPPPGVAVTAEPVGQT